MPGFREAVGIPVLRPQPEANPSRKKGGFIDALSSAVFKRRMRGIDRRIAAIQSRPGDYSDGFLSVNSNVLGAEITLWRDTPEGDTEKLTLTAGRGEQGELLTVSLRTEVFEDSCHSKPQWGEGCFYGSIYTGPGANNSIRPTEVIDMLDQVRAIQRQE